MMTRIPVFALALSVAAFAQYKAEPAGAPPAGLDPAVAAALSKTGTKILKPDGGVLCEVWLTGAAPKSTAAPEDAATMAVAQGALLGVIHFPAKGADRRNQTIAPGVYTMRYSMFPQNGDHQGVAPQRDFALLTPAADDKDAAATPDFNTLVNWSKKASGTPHPAVFSMWKQEPGDFKEGFAALGEHDWVLQGKAGDVMVAIILVGVAEG